MRSFEPGHEVAFEIVSRRNNSSTPRARLLVFGSLGFFTLLVAVGFGLIGAWPVVPFAGIECCALYVAFCWLKRHDDDYESITIEGDDLVVETRNGTTVARKRISRFWAQVVVQTCANGRRRVSLRANGRDIVFGRLLSDEAKLSVAKRLRAKLSTMG